MTRVSCRAAAILLLLPVMFAGCSAKAPEQTAASARQEASAQASGQTCEAVAETGGKTTVDASADAGGKTAAETAADATGKTAAETAADATGKATVAKAEPALPMPDASLASVEYGSRVDIWPNPAGASKEKKADHMHITGLPADGITYEMGKMMVNRKYADAEEVADTFYARMILEPGLDKETYEDIPYVLACPVEDARGAVIILPGGGFAYKSMNFGNGESLDIARALNDAGYAAFVLNYRANPYEYPVPVLDVQRAVRFLRTNAGPLGFPAENIAVMGFSAGGYAAGSFINVLMGNDLFPEEYEPDGIDRTDDTVQAAMMIYPMLDFRYNVPMLFCVFDADTVRDARERQRLLKETDLSLRFCSASVPQFLAYGLKDDVVGRTGPRRYASVARHAGAPVTEHVLPDEGHVFDRSLYLDDMTKWLDGIVDR